MANYTRQEVLDIIERGAREHGIPRDDFFRFAYIETGGRFDPSVSRGPNSAKGLFQFVPSTAAQYGIQGRELDPVANTDAAARLYLDNRRALVARHQRDGLPYLSGKPEPDGLDMYMAHQQGAAGYRSIQAAIATGTFSRADTRGNILNNVSARDFERISGGSHADFARMNDRDMATAFTQYWSVKFGRVAIPEKDISPVVDAAQPRPQAPERPQLGESGRWPTPGNTDINRADKHGEGRGEFGTSRGGGARTHRGVDIQGSVGDPIVAYADGVVRVQRNNGAAGNTVTIDHGNGVVTRYMHLRDISVQDGQSVDAGVQIGTMGRTGNTPRHGDTHLHLEMLRDGRHIDPMRYLQVPGRQQQEGDRQVQPSSLRQGASGSEVRDLQTALSALGYRGADGRPLAADGDFGRNTDHGLRDFQRAHGLEVDGKLGPASRAALAQAAQRPLISEAMHPNHGLFMAIGERLPPGTDPRVTANITLQALENGIANPDQLRGLAWVGSNVHLQGPYEGARVSVDLNAPTPDLQAMSDHMRTQTQGRVAQEEQRRQQQSQAAQTVSI